jgi:hypothetical protein
MNISEFTYVPFWGKFLDQLAKAAIREPWGTDYSYLRTYCEANFELAYDQGLIYEDIEKRFAIWRVGHLVTSDGTPIYAYLVRNNLDGKQPYVLVTALWSHRLVVKYRSEKGQIEERIPVQPPPNEPRYLIPAYQPEYRIEYAWDHFLSEHFPRLRDALPGLSQRTLYVSVFGATELAHRLHRQNAVPQYHRGRYQYLLPLYITHDNMAGKPDLVAALEEDSDRSVYVVRTLLEPEMAYANARCVATNISQFRSWVEDAPKLPDNAEAAAR